VMFTKPYSRNAQAGPQGAPAHIVYKLNGVEVGQVYPIKDYVEQWQKENDNTIADTLAKIKDLLDANPAAPAAPLPVLPPQYTTNDLACQFKPVDFGGGRGYRFVGRFTQDQSPVVNAQLRYYYQGLTDDGQYLVSFALPIALKSLPQDNPQVPADVVNQAQQGFDAYLSAVKEQCQSAFAGDFEPLLDQLDAVMQSIAVAPESLAPDAVNVDLSALGQSVAKLLEPARSYDAATLPGPQGAPTHVKISLDDQDDIIRVYPVAAYVAMWQAGGNDLIATTLESFKQLMATRPPAPPAPLPILPPRYDIHDLACQVNYLDFGNGSGYRFVSRFTRNQGPVTNDQLQYVYVGLSSDSRYLVVVQYPISWPGLPNTADDLQPDTINAAIRDYAGYLQNLTDQCQAANGDAFTPSLNTLDNVVKSITLNP
jgi:hypothetical protein